MALKKLKKYPKKPKSTASAATIDAYFDKCKNIDKENAGIKSDNAKTIAARKKLASFVPGKSKAPGSGKRRKSAPKKKAAKRRRR